MGQQRQHALWSLFSNALLPGAGPAHQHRINGFKVAGIGNEMDGAALAGGGLVLAGGPEVVANVAAAEHVARVRLFEVGEKLTGRPPHDV